MTHFPSAFHKLVRYLTSMGGTVMSGATLSEREVDAVARTPVNERSSGLTESTNAAPALPTATTAACGLLVINADDWGRDRENTDRTLECFLSGTISSVSAMVFMEDSERSATLAQKRGIDAGLHLNFTSPFSASGTATRLQEHQQRITKYLRRHRFAEAIFNPGLARPFAYVARAQLDEFQRLYGRMPERIDGHHHMHLSANVLLGKILPQGTLVRRSFSVHSGEKSLGNRLYRGLVNTLLARRHRTTDFFFSLPPLVPAERLQRIFSLARKFSVEVETHPINPEEYRFLTQGGISRFLGDIQIARQFGPIKKSAASEPKANTSTFRDRLTCSLPYALALGATLYQSFVQLFECS